VVTGGAANLASARRMPPLIHLTPVLSLLALSWWLARQLIPPEL
jgi:hypothetical protein